MLLWRNVSSLVIFPLIPFAFNYVCRRQLVGVGVETGPGFISISPATEAEVGAAVPASTAPPPMAN